MPLGLVFVLLGAAASPQDPARDPAIDTVALVRAVAPSVATLHLLGADGRKLGLGSGFVVEGGRIATARHGLITAAEAVVEFADGRMLRVAGVCAADAENDVALLALELPDGAAPPPALTLAAEDPPAGTRVLAFGSPLGLGETVSDGLISAVGHQPGIGRVLTISAPISPGSSGGPVVDPGARVVGLVRGQHPGGQNVNFAAPAAALRALRIEEPVPLAVWSARVRAAEPAPEVAAAVANAMLLLEQDRADAALPLAARACELDPLHTPAWHVRALCEQALGFADAALQSYQKALALEPRDPEILTNFGVLLGDAGRFEQEFEAYRRALEASPGYLPALHNLGATCEKQGKVEWAAHWFREALRHDENDFDALGGLGRVAGRRGRHDEAAATFEKIRAARPDDARNLRNLAAAYANLGRKDEALAVVRRCLELEPTLASASEQCARLLGELGRRDEQYLELKRLMRLVPDSAAAHVMMGELLIERGDRSGAYAEFQILQRLDPERAAALLEKIYPG